MSQPGAAADVADGIICRQGDMATQKINPGGACMRQCLDLLAQSTAGVSKKYTKVDTMHPPSHPTILIRNTKGMHVQVRP
jgi:hypothetical protein